MSITENRYPFILLLLVWVIPQKTLFAGGKSNGGEQKRGEKMGENQNGFWFVWIEGRIEWNEKSDFLERGGIFLIGSGNQRARANDWRTGFKEWEKRRMREIIGFKL
jgi:hypothetical protein